MISIGKSVVRGLFSYKDADLILVVEKFGYILKWVVLQLHEWYGIVLNTCLMSTG